MALLYTLPFIFISIHIYGFCKPWVWKIEIEANVTFFFRTIYVIANTEESMDYY